MMAEPVVAPNRYPRHPSRNGFLCNRLYPALEGVNQGSAQESRRASQLKASRTRRRRGVNFDLN
jgi:hypothetical protein